MTRSRLVSRAMRYAATAARAQAASALRDARSAASTGVAAAREAARINSYIVPTTILGAEDTGGGTAKITTADHKRVYPVEGIIDVPDVNLVGIADVTGLANGTHYFVYYDDPTLAAIAPVAHATTDAKVAQSGYAAGRHYLGDVTTPAGGAVATSGDGPAPGGYDRGTGGVLQ
jgi:hypothetical protein